MSRVGRTTKQLTATAYFALALTAGCQENLSSVVGKAEAAANTELELTRKLDPYLQCLEEHSGGIRDAKRQYVASLDSPGQQPNCGRRRYTVYRLAPVADCVRELELARKSMPSLPALEKVGARFAAGLTSLAALLERAHGYYTGRTYRQDACAMGRTLHRQLLKTWTELTRDEGALRDLLEAHDANLLQQELERTLKQHGKGLRFYRKRVEVEARRVLRVVKQQASDRSASLEALSTATAEFQATIQALRHVAKKMPEQAGAALFWDSYVAQTSEFLNAVTEFSRRRMQGRAYTVEEQKRLASGVAHWVVGSAAKVQKEHAELSRISAGLEFRH